MGFLRKIREQRIVDRAYANGYEQGRFDAAMDAAESQPCDSRPVDAAGPCTLPMPHGNFHQDDHGNTWIVGSFTTSVTGPQLRAGYLEADVRIDDGGASDFARSDLSEAYRQLDEIVTAFMLGDVDGAAVSKVQQRYRPTANR